MSGFARNRTSVHPAPKEWTRQQWQEWHKLCDWSHSSMIYDATRKLFEHAGLDINKFTAGQVFNIQDDLAAAIRRGAIRMLNQLNGIEDNGEL